MRWIHSIIIPYYRTSNISYNTTYHILSIYLITRSLANPINVPYDTPSDTPSPHFTTPLTIGPALVEYLSQRNITHSYDAGGGEMEVTIRPKWWWGYVRVALHQRCSTSELLFYSVALFMIFAHYLTPVALLLTSVHQSRGIVLWYIRQSE